MRTLEIDENQALRILRLEEGHFLDLKAIDVKPAKLTKSIAAFANSSGGELYVGIDEVTTASGKARAWRGFDDPEAANGHIQALEKLFPLGDSYSYDFLSSPGRDGLVLHLTVLKSRDIAVASDGDPYVRRGAQNLPIRTPEALARLRLDKGIESFEEATVNVDLKSVLGSDITRRFIQAVVPRSEPGEWFSKQLIIRQGKPTVGCVLLFSDLPQAALPKRSGIKLYRFGTIDAEGTRDTMAFDPITVEGSLTELIKEAVDLTALVIEEVPRLGDQGLEAVAYPREAIHEIITNAVLHRDYSIPADVQVRIFDNRVEIESPGRLPGHITPKNILSEQYARNGNLVRLANKFPDPPNKDIGEGLNTAFLSMSKLRLRPPEILETENSVRVVLRHERLASADSAILEYLETHGKITNKIAREITGIASESTIKVAFWRLRDRGLLELTPGTYGRSASWRTPLKE